MSKLIKKKKKEIASDQTTTQVSDQQMFEKEIKIEET